jgi:hypothetical protein
MRLFDSAAGIYRMAFSDLSGAVNLPPHLFGAIDTKQAAWALL